MYRQPHVYASLRLNSAMRMKIRRSISLLALALLSLALWACGYTATASGGGGGLTPTNTVRQFSPTSAPATPAHPGSTATPIPARSTPVPGDTGWDWAVVATGHAGALPFWQVNNYDPVSGKDATLVQQPPYLGPDAIIDGISPDGKNLLYQLSSSGHTLYYTLVQISGTGYFFELNDASAGRALWLPDSRHVLVLSLGSAVWNVDTQTGSSTKVLALPIVGSRGLTQIAQMSFYRDNYLYFVAGAGFGEGSLCRVPLNSSSPTVQQISFRSLGASYWLSPDGQTIYFANKAGPAGTPGIYAVHIDGTNLHLLRTYPQATPIGYAADNALEIMLLANGKFEIMKLGATPAQDQVVQANAAPGAVNLCNPATPPGMPGICDANIALAPYGHAALVLGFYADTTFKLWSDDLVTGKQHVLLTLGDHYQVQLPGWDRIPV